MGAGALADYEASEDVFVGGHLNYWRGENEDISPNASVSDLIVGAHTRTVFAERSSMLRPFAQVGLDMHRLTFETGKSDNPNTLGNEAREFETRLGLSGGLGVLVAMNSSLDATAGLQYRYIFGDDEVRYNQLGFSGGLAYRL